ncbi:hypothetical protein Goshw_025572, partial [Gossypium schwendimanii]|nr:hypothetical protein [Gossypium schwendimanii]
ARQCPNNCGVITELFLKIHDAAFASRPKLQFADYVSYGNKGLAFAPYGSFWRTVRKWCTLQLLSSSKVELFEPIRRREVESLVDRIKRAAASGQVVDLSAKAVELMENIMYRMIIGRSKDDKFDLKPLIQQALRLSGHFNIADYVPFLAPLYLQVSLFICLLYVYHNFHLAYYHIKIKIEDQVLYSLREVNFSLID